MKKRRGMFMDPKHKRVLQVCLVLLVVSLVIMTVSSIIDHGSVEATNFIPFIGIVPITARLIKEGKNDK